MSDSSQVSGKDIELKSVSEVYIVVSLHVILSIEEMEFMFSREDLRTLSLKLEFPAEKEESLAEKVYKNVSLSTLKLEATTFLSVTSRALEAIPLIRAGDPEKGIVFSISRNSIRLTLTVERPPFLSEEEEEKEAVIGLFNEKTLSQLSNDLNFLIGRVSSLVETKGLKIESSGNARLRRKEPDFSDLSNNFSNNLITSLREFGEVHFSGLSFELKDTSRISKIEYELSDEMVTVSVDFHFSCEQPINMTALIQEILDEVNSVSQKLKVGQDVAN